MDEKLHALKLVLHELKKENIEHSIGGSGLLYFLGLTENVGDWDILTSASSNDIETIFEKFNPKKLGINETYHSDFLYQLFINDVKVEVIGNFKYKLNNELIKVDSTPSLFIDEIPLASPDDWIKFYKMMGKINNVYLLENWIKSKN